ncbi:MFS transporter [Bailinhaonella thermotolerans]|uniref:MFS transporter n=2 Tax=Bailinhaonella thermotolerans TaxID=1070861 RepID=A0A3A4B9U6_9ACTN|nr:MFS transporter [Bailinhaonella thermotolerans]
MVAAPQATSPQDAPGTPEYAARMRYAWRVCSVTSLGLILIGVNGSTLNVALPEVVRHFDAGPFAASWILLSFLLVNTASLVFFARIADLFGRRETYLLGFAVFTLAALLSGFAPNVWVLIALRAVQALGASMILANGTVIITGAFPPDRLSEGMGVYMGTLSVAQLAGPTVGGLIADTLGWRGVFWFNVPFGLAALVWGLIVLRRVPRREREPVDALGNLLIFVALSGALVSLSEAGSGGVGPLVIGGAAAFAVLLPVLLLVERRAANPVLDLRLFGERSLAFANLASFCNALARSAVVLLLALYFQAVRGMNAFEAALAVLPTAVGMAIASPVAGRLGRRVRPHALAVAGASLSAAGLLVLLVSAGPRTPYAVLAAGLFLAGCGSGAFLTGNTTQVMSELPADRLGVVNGFRVMVMNVGIVLSVALTLSLLTSALTGRDKALVYAGTLSRLSPEAVEGLVTGYQRALAALAAVALAAIVSAALARSRRS